MLTFKELIREIRDEAGLTQAEFAKALDVSPVLIAMVETGQKEVSKKMVSKLAILLDVHPISITPFLYSETNHGESGLSSLEKSLVNWGEKMQRQLIKKNARALSRYGT